MTDIEARLDRIERLLEHLAEARPDTLSAALRRAMAGEPTTAGELWRLAEAQDLAAASTGMPRPELAEALDLTGIASSHGLGRWLARHEGRGFTRVGTVSTGALWLAE